MSDTEKFQAALAPLVDLIKRVRRERDEAIQRFQRAASTALRDATKATQADFQLTPPEPACPPVDDPDFPQVSGSRKSSPQEAE